MKIYIDLFFIFNYLMDFAILLSTSTLIKRNTSLKRIILSSLLGAVSSLLILLPISRILIQIIFIILISIIAFGYKNIRYTIKNIFYIYVLSLFLGGLIYLFNIKVSSSPILTYAIILIISCEALVLYVKEMKRVKENYNNYYKVDIYFKDNDKLSLVGFLDTGNNLHDPYQKRPIIIVSSKYTKEGNYLLVPYYTINNKGMLKCLKPEKVYIDDVLYPKQVLVAFSQSPMNIDGGIDVILHKDLMKGIEYEKSLKTIRKNI